MTTIIEFLGAILLSFVTACAVYGIMSPIVKYKSAKDLEKYMKERERRGNYDDDDDDYYD